MSGGANGFAGRGGFEGFDFSGFNNGASDFADIFETFFGGAGGKRRGGKKNGPMRGNDIEANIKISFNEAVFGCQKELEIIKSDVCQHCNGGGAEPGSSIVSCGSCRGSGEIRSVQNTILGQITTSHVCNECGGTGKVSEKKCSVCHGTTRVRTKEHVKVKIPAGVDNGSTIRVSEKGEGGIKGGHSGDLYIILTVEQSKKFIRDSYDIHTEIEIPLVQAVLGGEADVTTIHGVEKIKIPAGTEDGKVFKLSGKGVPKLNNDGTGDHLLKVRIKIPQKLSKRERELFEELAKESGLDTKKKGWF